MMLQTFAHRVDIRWQRLEHSCRATWLAQHSTCLDTRSSEIWVWCEGSWFDRGPLSERSARRFKRSLGATSLYSHSFARTRVETRSKPCWHTQANWARTPCSESAMTRRRSSKVSRKSSLTEQRLSSNRTREQATKENGNHKKHKRHKIHVFLVPFVVLPSMSALCLINPSMFRQSFLSTKLLPSRFFFGFRHSKFGLRRTNVMESRNNITSSRSLMSSSQGLMTSSLSFMT